MAFNVSYLHLTCGLSAVLIALMYIYPIIFYIFLFIVYSLILVLCGESSAYLHIYMKRQSQPKIFFFSVLFVQYNKSKPSKVIKPVQASAILYNATRWVTRAITLKTFSYQPDLFRLSSSRMFDVPKRSKANLSVIFGRTVDKLLQQVLENALNDFINSWLRWVIKILWTISE